MGMKGGVDSGEMPGSSSPYPSPTRQRWKRSGGGCQDYVEGSCLESPIPCFLFVDFNNQGFLDEPIRLIVGIAFEVELRDQGLVPGMMDLVMNVARPPGAGPGLLYGPVARFMLIVTRFLRD